MSTKTISIKDDVYRQLMETKREDESLSDVIERLLKKEKTDLSAFFGALKNSELLDEIEEDSKRIRASARSRI
jgi:predicted CopG family antitoxin